METVIDTLKICERLKAANLPDSAAKEIAEVMRETIDEKLATKRDLKELEVALKRNLKKLELRLTVKLGAIVTAGSAAIAAIVKLL